MGLSHYHHVVSGFVPLSPRGLWLCPIITTWSVGLSHYHHVVSGFVHYHHVVCGSVRYHHVVWVKSVVEGVLARRPVTIDNCP